MDLPNEIQEYILGYVNNITTITQCMLVCTYWFDVLRRINHLYNKNFQITSVKKYAYRLLSLQNIMIAESPDDPLARLMLCENGLDKIHEMRGKIVTEIHNEVRDRLRIKFTMEIGVIPGPDLFCIYSNVNINNVITYELATGAIHFTTRRRKYTLSSPYYYTAWNILGHTMPVGTSYDEFTSELANIIKKYFYVR